MHFNRLSLVNFKNYSEADISFSKDVNCLVGNNGSGKTNILDAIYYSCFTKSFLNPLDSQNIRHDEPFFVIESEIEEEDKTDKIYCGVKRGLKKNFKRNSKEYDRLADHIGKYPAVIITPGDVDLIKEGSETRRKFIDSIISQYDKTYLENLILYNRAVQQRNVLLKYFAENRTFDSESLEIWDEKIVPLAAIIHGKRQEFVEGFKPVFIEMYQSISKGKENVSLDYLSDLNTQEMDVLLSSNIHKDRAARRTGVGIHKDDLICKIGDHPIKKFGSQGQQKTFLISLKLAQFKFIQKAKGKKPILLLDDVFDKIDDERVSALMELVSQNLFGQIFITDTHSLRVPKLFEKLDVEMKVFLVNDAEISELNHSVNA